MPSKKYFHICSVNSKGLLQSEKRKRLIEWTTQQKSDILFIQETHFTGEIENKLKSEFVGDLFLSNGQSNSRGVAIWLKHSLNYKIIDNYKDNEGRILLINIELDDNIFTFVNIYAPNNVKARNTFFRERSLFTSWGGWKILGGWGVKKISCISLEVKFFGSQCLGCQNIYQQI